jgi:hypothetical protein
MLARLMPLVFASNMIIFFSGLLSTAAFSDAQQTAQKALADDKKQTNAWIQTETVNNLLQSNNSKLSYFAVQLGSVKDKKSLDRVFETSTNDHVDEFCGRDCTVGIIRAGSKYFTGGAADSLIDFGNKVTSELERLSLKPKGANPGSRYKGYNGGAARRNW